MEGKFELATTRDFNGLTLNCYREEGQEASGEFWMTREQIGQLLGYEKPNNAITIIHKRNKERMDRFSTSVKLTQVEGNRTVTRDVRVYNFKGLLEICRYSNQPTANAVIDVLWSIADEIRRTGMYITSQALRRLEERVASMERQLEDDRAFTNLGRVVLSLPGSVTFQTAAQFLSQHGFETGQNRLFRYCRDKKLICSRKGRQWNKPSQRSLEQGLFSMELSGGFKGITMITPCGLSRILEMLSREEYPLLMAMETEGE